MSGGYAYDRVLDDLVVMLPGGMVLDDDAVSDGCRARMRAVRRMTATSVVGAAAGSAAT